MEIRESFRLEVPPAKAARILVDVPLVAGCVPGVQDVEQQEDGSWSAVLGAQLGPIRARFAGTMSIDDSEVPERLSARGQGRDRGTGSQASVFMVATLRPAENDGTQVEVVADVVIRGRLGQFGTGIISVTAREMTKAFVDCLRAQMAPRPEPVPAVVGKAAREEEAVAAPDRPTAPLQPRQPRAAATSPFRVLGRAVLVWARGILHRVVSRVRR
jgi:carbon monoxide dehydrogenase subunit G